MRKNDIEKSLKRFLKRKVSYSLSLLIAFMITGGISLGAGITAEEIQETKGELLTRIQTEREEIKRKIAENERLIKEYNSEFVELVRKGDFYSKPLFNTTQIFFTYQYLDNGKMKDRTEKEFAETIDAINKHYGTKSGRSILKSSGNIGKDKIMSGNGVAVDTEVFRETIEVGANIVPVEPILPEINKTINITVGVPTIGGIPTITAPTIAAPTAPAAITTPTINVTTPGAVASINVTAPSVPTPTVPGDKTIVKPTVAIPNAVDPTMVVAPTAPDAPDTPVIVPPTITLPNPSGGNSYAFYYWDTSKATSSSYNGIIGDIIVTGGEFTIGIAGNVADNGYTIEAKNYTGEMPVLSAADAAATGSSAASSNGWVSGGTLSPANYSATVGNGGMGIYRIVDTPYGGFRPGTKVTINSTRTGNMRQFIHHDPHSYYSASSLASITNATSAELSEAQLMETKYKHPSHNLGGYYQILSLQGEITVNGGYMMLVGTQGHSGRASNVYVMNSGDIKINGNSNAVFGYTNANDNAARYYYVDNLSGGNIAVTGDKNAVIAMSKSSANHVHNFRNNGTITINGDGNAGVYIVQNINDGTVDLQTPITITGGTKNAGIFHVSQSKNNMNPESLLNVSITGGNGNVGYYSTHAQTLLSTGVNNANNYSHIFELSGGTGNAGVLSAANLNIGNGLITLSGGVGNVGLVARSGDLISTGAINITGGTSNVGVISENGKTASVGKLTSTGTANNAMGLFASGSGSVANVTTDIDMKGLTVTGANTGNKYNTMAAFAENNGIININNSILGTSASPDIEVTGMALTDASSMYRGIGLMADGGTINVLSPVYIKVTNGAAGVASINTNGNINIAAGSTIEVDNGYAVYSDGTGKINMQNSTIILGGNATAFDIYKSGTNPLTVTGTTVKVVSNDVIVFNVKNITAPLDVSTLEASINPGVTVTNDGIHTQYIEAAVDKAIINVDTTLNKADTSGASFYFYNRFIAQNSILNVNQNVTSELATSQTTNFKGQVIALEMNASKSATSNATSQINIASSATVKAGRTDAGAGAVGAFINYGQINNDGTIEVQK
ncbi:autotransporter-associated N-terminal domain-containing protein, partial [Fusobacterium ulcerans]|uniref:autotransporter-associated N-terminal domain-containing protein n=1 Tax=Fusobacterium ulcerans TaxID=861 RepID=UPI003FEFA1D2